MLKKHFELQPIFLTEEKLQEILNELNQIEIIVLPEIRKRMADAYEDGDMPENNPWLTANVDLNDAMRRKNELLELKARAKLYKGHLETGVIHLGSVITIKIDDGKEFQVKIVASEESDPIVGKMSVDSPIGKALLGAAPNQTVIVETPQKKIVVTVLKKH